MATDFPSSLVPEIARIKAFFIPQSKTKVGGNADTITNTANTLTFLVSALEDQILHPLLLAS